MRAPDLEMIRRVKELRGRGLGYLSISKLLTQELDKKVHQNSVVRWSKMAHLLPR